MHQFKMDFGGRDLIVEIGKFANQADGAVTVRYGGTVVLVTAVMSKEAHQEMDYMPLMVDYEEKFYAAGKIKGSRFMKREGKAPDDAVLSGRLIDRTIRPRFNQKIRNEVQVIATILSFDKENDPDILALFGASLALFVSDIPWDGPVAGARVGMIDGQWLLNPSYENRKNSQFDIVVAGTKEKINMLEAGANEMPEEIILSAIEFGHKYIQKVVEFQEQIAKEIGKPKREIKINEPDEKFRKDALNFLNKDLEQFIYEKDKQKRNKNLDTLRKRFIEYTETSYPDDKTKVHYAYTILEEETDRIVHKNILEKEMRPDGRKLDEIRSLNCEAAVLPCTHGSGLFQRGETQALSVLTLGAPDDEIIIETMEFDEKRRFMHHYNFPPFSVNEVKPMRGPGRRDIGHGALAEKAIFPLLPQKETFPYAIRVVSEILSSNGSSSMASVSGTSLALMDGGVPIKRAAAGIAMGLVMENEKKYKILTDIQGPEDHYGDMDLKVAGTKKGVTAIQMDVKIEGVTAEILKESFEQAKKARMQILEIMDKVISAPRENLSPFAPRIITIQINPDKIRDVIGPGGKVINAIIKETGVDINVEDDGLVYVTSVDQKSGEKAAEWIRNIVREAKAGEVFSGKVTRIFPFGAMVEILPGQEGLIHISELSTSRIKNVEDVVKIGDAVLVKVKEIDRQGRINLSLKSTQKQ
ncbi:MAG: polyribonucleotide nucleotidyltransferase [Parcubacteria group bacterium GW2011_GWA2_38_13b]|nr:MAG: polyribonucleotide nucleotidyltransferase [Parcubacteria group bacterium GW2011_GWA2_38_13b]